MFRKGRAPLPLNLAVTSQQGSISVHINLVINKKGSILMLPYHCLHKSVQLSM